MEWFFSGLGTAVISGIISFIVGCVIGYNIGVSSRNKQSQKAGDNSNQFQIGNTTNIDGRK